MVHCAATSAGAHSSHNLLVVGPGVLGSYLSKLWLDEFGAGTVTGQTNTSSNHGKLRSLGVTPRTKEQAGAEKFPYVAYCAPPSGSTDYPGDVKQALALWDGTGAFVFTSSAGLYTVDDGSPCDENGPVAALGSSPRTDALLNAERAVLEAGGCVVRLVGLYHRTRGAHTFFLKMGTVERWGGYTVNLIHYEDAAGLTAAVLRGQGSDGAGHRGRVFLGCDGAPITFNDMMAAVEASGVLPGSVTFSGQEGPSKGKLVSNDATRREVQWQPKYPSISDFFASGARDWYVEDLAPTGAKHA